MFYDCTRHGPEVINELFVVEGLSAATNLQRARDAKTQAVLALQGKPVNAAKVSAARVGRNQELQTLTSALGCGWTADFDLRALRYKQINLLFDPDADGIHCSALVQIFLQKCMPGLIVAEKVAVIRAPLFQITLSESEQHKSVLAYSQQHYDKICQYLRETQTDNFQTTRFKGVASLSVKVLREKCVAAETRNSQILRSEDALMAVRLFGGK